MGEKLNTLTLGAACSYTNNVVSGMGAIKGAPCQIQSITAITGGNRVTFLWVDNSDVSHTSTMDIMDGDKGDTGKGIKSVAINSSNHLIVTFDDNTSTDAGELTDLNTTIEHITDVELSNLANGQILQYNSTTQKWQNANPGAVSTNLDDLGDVDIDNVSDGQIIAWDSDKGRWVNEDNAPTITIDTNPTSGSTNAVSSGGVYSALSGKADSSSLSDYVQKSQTAGLLKNDGTVDTNTYAQSSALSDYIAKSQTAGLMKNDGTVDTTTYAASSALSDYIAKSNTSGLMKNDGSVDTTITGDVSGIKAVIPSTATTSNKLATMSDVGGGHTIEGDGVAVTDRDTLNFKDMSVADDSTNLATNVTPHRLTQAELTDILSPLPSAYVNSSLTVDAYNFSTTEKVIGTWIDGKPIYQITVDLGAQQATSAIGANQWFNTHISSSGMSQIVGVKAYNTRQAQSLFVYEDVRANTNAGNGIEIKFPLEVYIDMLTIQYTKTTDTAVSTGEKIVGTFVDGKPIYQRTWNPNVTIGSDWYPIIDVSSVGIDVLLSIEDYSVYNGILYGSLIAMNGAQIALYNNTISAYKVNNYPQTIYYLTLRYTKV